MEIGQRCFLVMFNCSRRKCVRWKVLQRSERFAGVDRVIIMVVGCGFGEHVGPLDPLYFPSEFCATFKESLCLTLDLVQGDFRVKHHIIKIYPMFKHHPKVMLIFFTNLQLDLSKSAWSCKAS